MGATKGRRCSRCMGRGGGGAGAREEEEHRRRQRREWMGRPLEGRGRRR
jgi:hypothetical protein